MPQASPQTEVIERREDVDNRVRDQLRAELERELTAEARKGDRHVDGSQMFTDT